LTDFAFTRRQFLLLAFLTLAWGVNWPVMKVGVTGFPPLFFRTVSMWLGLPVLAAVLAIQRVPFRIARRDWRELVGLSITNMIVWHILAILAVQALSSGRAAILGYTMPIFSALWGLGTQQMRRTRIAAPTLAIVFWMTALSTLVMSVATFLFERDRWQLPGAPTALAIAYNAVLIFGLAQPIWLVLARNLPPIASSMSVMLIPVLGTVSGAWWLSEALHWQDGAAIALVLVAIASVMWPTRSRRAPAEAAEVGNL